jgi:hypothetical protein
VSEPLEDRFAQAVREQVVDARRLDRPAPSCRRQSWKSGYRGFMITPEADNSRQAQERVGGALGWLGERCKAGGAVEGGGSSGRRIASIAGGVSGGALDVRASE